MIDGTTRRFQTKLLTHPTAHNDIIILEKLRYIGCTIINVPTKYIVFTYSYDINSNSLVVIYKLPVLPPRFVTTWISWKVAGSTWLYKAFWNWKHHGLWCSQQHCSLCSQKSPISSTVAVYSINLQSLQIQCWLYYCISMLNNNTIKLSHFQTLLTRMLSLFMPMRFLIIPYWHRIII